MYSVLTSLLINKTLNSDQSILYHRQEGGNTVEREQMLLSRTKETYQL